MKALGLSVLLTILVSTHILAENAQVYNFKNVSKKSIQEISQKDIDIWSLDRKKSNLTALVSNELISSLKKYRPQIDHIRTQKYINNLNKESVPRYSCYRIVEKTYEDISLLQRENPGLVEVETIGESWQKVNKQKGYDLLVIKITNQKTSNIKKPILFIDASVHAREMATAELAVRFAESLVSRYKTDSGIKKLLDNKEVHIVPFVNPDGRKFAEDNKYKRKNHNEQACRFGRTKKGVDLNRNFDTIGWGTGNGGEGSSSQCSDTYRGTHSHSEPETQTLVNYLESIFTSDTSQKPSGMYISLHSYSELILLPNASDAEKKTEAYKKVVRFAKEMSLENGYEACVGDECLYPVHGSSDQWAYETFKIPSYTFELGKNFFESCEFFENDVLPKNMRALYKGLELVQ